MPNVPEISPSDFLDRWPDFRDGTAILLDVREPYELAAATIDGTINIPMGEVPQRLDELSRELPLVVVCHGGTRSRRVAEFLRAQGFENVLNLTGGIDAWSVEIDSSIPRY